ncbi:MAG: DUF559 domain-containing protein, partial [Rickettsiales bacterium]|nr:DUF559 domain-containing protein [Rickettsiales bacterium]
MWKNDINLYSGKLKKYASNLRKAGNLSEALLWLRLKRKQLNGLDFDRQKPIGNYIADFYCKEIKLAIEIDGGSHEYKEEYDKTRDEYFCALGIKTIRIKDIDIKTKLNMVMEMLDNETKRKPTPSVADATATPPQRGIVADGNWAAADVAFRVSEFIPIYPITPSSTMGELADEWAFQHRKNIWGAIPSVVEMQSEGGAAGAMHGALQVGAMATTFTASQGLLLMIPNMYKIAGEQTPFVMHVAARAIATHALSIFGDHSDVMSVRGTGFAMLSSAKVQQAHDMAAIAHAATLRARVPFLHFFDGFRTSHEESRLTRLSDDDLRKLVPTKLMLSARNRGMTPDAPTVRGTAQNPDVFFQGREAANKLYDAVPDIVADVMDEFGKITGRNYKTVEYFGDPAAENIIVAMGSATETIIETLNHLPAGVGAVVVHLYRPFPVRAFRDAIPKTAKRIAVLDRTKEPGAIGEPLYLDVVAALPTRARKVFGGRYGLGSKEFKPRDVKAIVENMMRGTLKHNFTVGIRDDVTKLSLATDAAFANADDGYKSAILYGIGSDGTVGAVKNIVKIVGENSDLYPQ